MDENPYEPSQSNERRVRRPRGLTLNARDMFGVAVRTTGVVLIAFSGMRAAGMVTPDEYFTRLDYFLLALPPFIIGGILLLAAEGIVSFAYGSRYELDEGDAVEESHNE